MREKMGNWGCCMFVSSKLHLWRYQAQIWSCMSVLPRPHMTLIVQVLIHKMVASTIQNPSNQSTQNLCFPIGSVRVWGTKSREFIVIVIVCIIIKSYPIQLYVYIYNFTLFHGHLEKCSYKKFRFHHVSRPSLVPSPASSSRCSAREAEAPEAPRLHSLRRRTSRRQPGVSSSGNLRPDLRVWISLVIIWLMMVNVLFLYG